jgi:hypothetical protein
VPGTSFSITVASLGSGGTVNTGYRGTVHFTSTDSLARLPADYTYQASDLGVHTFAGVILETTATVTATDVTTSCSGSLAVAQQVGPQEHPFPPFVVTAPAAVVPGSPFTITVDASKDPFATAHFTSSDSAATLPGDYTFTPADPVHTFVDGVALPTPGPQTITATRTADGLSSSVQVLVGLLDALTPAGAASGVPFGVTVSALDSSGNVVTGYRGTVRFSSTDGAATLPEEYTFTDGDQGVHTFAGGVTLRTVGHQQITVTDTVAPQFITSAAVEVDQPIRIDAPPQAPFPSSVAVTVQAPPDYTGTVHFSSSDPRAVLPGDDTFTPAEAAKSYAVGFLTPGPQTITVADLRGGLSASMTVMVSQFEVAPSLLEGTAGSAFSITVTALDGSGNTNTDYRGTVQFSSTDGQASLPGSYTFTARDQGVHTFNKVVLRTAGTQAITVTDNSPSPLTGFNSVLVDPAAASQFDLLAPVSAAAGVPVDVKVLALDGFGNVATGFRGTVHFSSNDPSATLPGDYSFTSDDRGLHTFSGGVTLRTLGNRNLKVSDVAGVVGMDVEQIHVVAATSGQPALAPAVSAAQRTEAPTVLEKPEAGPHRTAVPSLSAGLIPATVEATGLPGPFAADWTGTRIDPVFGFGTAAPRRKAFPLFLAQWDDHV